MTSIKNILFFALYILVNPRLIRKIIQGLYLPVYAQYEWLKKYKIHTIIDIGAYHGLVAEALSYIFPKADIYCFEPIEENIRKIRRRKFSKTPTIERIAVSNKVGNSSFYKNSFSPASSLKRPRILEGFGFISRFKRTTVPTTTLDAYFGKTSLKEKIFLKIDVQGAEDMVLEGGRELLKRVSIVHIETAFRPLYKGERLFGDIYNLLIDEGFKYAGEIPDAEFYPQFGQTEYSNSIFIKSKLLDK